MKRFNIKKILASPKLRRRIMVNSIISIQAREGIVTTKKQAAAAIQRIKGGK